MRNDDFVGKLQQWPAAHEVIITDGLGHPRHPQIERLRPPGFPQHPPPQTLHIVCGPGTADLGLTHPAHTVAGELIVSLPASAVVAALPLDVLAAHVLKLAADGVTVGGVAAMNVNRFLADAALRFAAHVAAAPPQL